MRRLAYVATWYTVPIGMIACGLLILGHLVVTRCAP